MRRTAGLLFTNGGGMVAHVMIRPAGVVIQAIGWVVLAAVTAKSLVPTDASVVLFSLVIAELLVRVLLVGVDRSRSGETLNSRWEDAVGQLLLRWVLLSVSLFLLALYRLIPFFHHQLYALICIFGLCLCLAMLRLICAFREPSKSRGRLLFEMRFILLAAGVIGLAKIGSLNADIVLSSAIGLVLLVLITVSTGFNTSRPLAKVITPSSDSFEQTLSEFSPFLLRHADLLILPWVMSPAVTLGYLIARGLAQFIPCVLDRLGGRLTNTLARNFTAGSYHDFVSGAARTNLGVLLIGGAASLAVFGIGVHIPQAFNLNQPHFQNVLFWLTVAQVAPIVFGATGLLMKITELRKEVIGLSLTGVVIVWSITFVLDIKDPQDLAQLYAYVEMTIAALASGILGLRFGIWPGLTALLFRQIKLL